MATKPALHLTPAQRVRIRAVWQTVTGHRPNIRLSRSQSREKAMARVVYVTLSYPNGACGYAGKKSHRMSWYDATKAIANFVVDGILTDSTPRPADELRVRMHGIMWRYLRDGTITKKELVHVARLPNSRGLTMFFAQLV